jgi:hypothetical protein
MHAGASFATFETLQGGDLAIQKGQAIAATLIFRIVERGLPLPSRYKDAVSKLCCDPAT